MTQQEKFEEIVVSFENGNFSQVKDQFYRLKNDDKLSFCTWLEKYSELEEKYKTQIFSFLLRKKCDR